MACLQETGTRKAEAARESARGQASVSVLDLQKVNLSPIKLE